MATQVKLLFEPGELAVLGTIDAVNGREFSPSDPDFATAVRLRNREVLLQVNPGGQTTRAKFYLSDPFLAAAVFVQMTIQPTTHMMSNLKGRGLESLVDPLLEPVLAKMGLWTPTVTRFSLVSMYALVFMLLDGATLLFFVRASILLLLACKCVP
jgi:hypothetical protein